MKLKTFLSYKFAYPKSEKLANEIKTYLRSRHIEVIDGKDLVAGDKLNHQIEDKICQCHILMSIRLNDIFSPYVIEEAAFARGKGIHTIIIAKDNKDNIQTGLFNDSYYIDVSKGVWQAVADINRVVDEIKFKERISQEPIDIVHSAENEIDGENWDPVVREMIREIKFLLNNNNIEDALSASLKLINDFDICWRGYVVTGVCYIKQEKFELAEKYFELLRSKFSAKSRPKSYYYQNRGVLNKLKAKKITNKVLEQTINDYKASIREEPRIVVYINLIFNLLEATKIQEAEKYLNELLQKWGEAKGNIIEALRDFGAQDLEQIKKSEIIYSLLFKN